MEDLWSDLVTHGHILCMKAPVGQDDNFPANMQLNKLKEVRFAGTIVASNT